MPTTARWLAAATLGSLLWAGSGAKREAPSYSASGVVNSASSTADLLAPNTIATIYGKGLAWSTRAIQAGDIAGGVLPSTLAGVRVLVRNVPAHLLYVSPTQINFVIPPEMNPGPAKLQVTVDGQAGPAIEVVLNAAAPALYLWPYTTTAIATRSDYSLVTAERPAHPGETIVLWATGLGATSPPAEYGRLAPGAANLVDASRFRVLLNGTPVNASLIAYAGLVPGYAAFYQVNVTLPDALSDDPEIRIGAGDQVSPVKVTLPLRSVGTR